MPLFLYLPLSPPISLELIFLPYLIIIKLNSINDSRKINVITTQFIYDNSELISAAVAGSLLFGVNDFLKRLAGVPAETGEVETLRYCTYVQYRVE